MRRAPKYSIVCRVIEVMRANRQHLPLVTPDIHAAVESEDWGLLPACQVHQALWTGRVGGMIYRCQETAVINGKSMVQWGLTELGLRLSFTGRPPVRLEVPVLHRLVERPWSTSPELFDVLRITPHMVSTKLRNLESNGMVSRDDNRPAKWAINWIEK